MSAQSLQSGHLAGSVSTMAASRHDATPNSEPVVHHVGGLNCSRVPRRFPHPFPMTAREALGRTDVQALEHRRRGRLTELLSRQYAGPDARTEKIGL